MNSILKGTILGGIILFIWSSISWTLLPWHMQTIHSFKNEAAVAQIMQDNVTKSGIYFSPNMEQQGQSKTTVEQKSMPKIFAAVSLEGMSKSMIGNMIISFIMDLAVAFLVVWLLMQTTNLSYLCRVLFVVVFGFSAGIMANVPYWNWFSFPLDYTLIMIADAIVSWFLAGVVIAAVARGK